MTVTLNGWTAQPVQKFPLMTGTVPGTTKRVTLDYRFLPIALACLADINEKLIPLAPGPLDGWEYREARTGAGMSNHASGTAFDFRYDVLKADHRQHLSNAQHAVMHTIMDKYRTTGGKRVLGWGGDWTVGKYCDEMHVEVGQSWSPGVGSPVTPADLANVIARLRLLPNGTTASTGGGTHGTSKPIPAPTRPIPAPLTGLSAYSTGPGRIRVGWLPGRDATSWEVAIAAPKRTTRGVVTIPRADGWGLPRGSVVTVSVVPRNAVNHGIGAAIKVRVS